MTAAMDQARAVADAVLYEGYLLYPYRASAAKNRVRWQWGVLMPPAFAAGGTGEHAESRTELLVEPGDRARLQVRLRFLQLQERIVESGGEVVPAVTVAGTEYTTWAEAVERETEAVLRFADLLGGDNAVPFTVDGGEDVEPVSDTVRVIRRRHPLHGVLRLRADALLGPFGGLKLRLDVENTASYQDVTREEALRHALIAAHMLLSVTSGHFLSMFDPPEWASVAVRECVNERSWPVLVGDAGQRDTVLSSPIILYDYPAIAAESAGNLFDGTEIDEILTLRTMTLTDEEKREARATDDRAAELIDRVDNLPPELLERLHGTVRYLRSVTGEPPEDNETVVVAGKQIRKGSRVRLRPNKRADAHDMFLSGRTAKVQAVLSDVDDNWHLAVTLEDDLGSELYAAHGRYRYFGTDEVEPL